MQNSNANIASAHWVRLRGVLRRVLWRKPMVAMCNRPNLLISIRISFDDLLFSHNVLGL